MIKNPIIIYSLFKKINNKYLKKDLRMWGSFLVTIKIFYAKIKVNLNF